MTGSDIGIILLQNLVALCLVMAAFSVVAMRIRDVSFIDAIWPLAMVFLALITWPRVAAADPLRQALLIGLVALWGVRLGLHLFLRWRRQGVDGRYQAIMAREQARGRDFNTVALTRIFLPQAVLAWLVALPVQLGQMAATPPVGWIAWIGVALALVGIAFETIGDAQLAAFKRDPASKGRVLDTGLWRYTRHPNYFGDACVWWGLWLIAAETLPGLFAILGPLFLTFTLTRWSGIGITEKAIHKSRPGYADYVARTSAFVPMPPRKRA
jgi:steroid 5-alpha reductase family enzyme